MHETEWQSAFIQVKKALPTAGKLAGKHAACSVK
jgi:hypothetical protein